MKERLKLIYGTDKINYLKKYITIIDENEINIFSSGDSFIAIQGRLLFSTPTETLKIKLTEHQKAFMSNKKDLYNFILTGQNPNIEKQKKIYTIAKIQLRYGTQIIAKQIEIKNAIEQMLKSGKNQTIITCDKSIQNILDQFVKKQYEHLPSKTEGNSIIITQN